ncbi:MAG: transglycosylase SLT domain-containing protein [Spirochaetales bacterium]|nr:transglycosylase SLT domain-containing protein [Spirochaetales bacterium]
MMESKIKIQCETYKPSRWKKSLHGIKRLCIVAFYVSLVVILFSFAENKTTALAKNVSSDELSNVHSENVFSGDNIKLDYYTGVIENKNIAKLAITYSEKEGIDTSLLVALMKTESNFNPNAINYNYNGSVDRGLCQLNSKTFPNLSKKDFYDPETNIKTAAAFLRWCMENSNHNLVKALAYYNAGWGNVTNENVGDLTLNYIQKITTYKKTFEDELELLELNY